MAKGWGNFMPSINKATSQFTYQWEVLLDMFSYVKLPCGCKDSSHKLFLHIMERLQNNRHIVLRNVVLFLCHFLVS